MHYLKNKIYIEPKKPTLQCGLKKTKASSILNGTFNKIN